MEKLTEGYGLIEGPVWDDERGLIFSDVLFGGIYALGADGEVTTVFEHRRGVGGMSIHDRAGLIVSGRNIAFKPFDGGSTVELLAQDIENDRVGFNDITTDDAGRVYAGSLGSSPVFDDGRPPQSGDLYLIDLDGSHRVVGHDVRLTNGLGFSPDGKTLYHSDSQRSAVMSYPVHADGSLGDKTVFAETSIGVPDGLAVAEDGSVWVALAAGGGAVLTVEPDGSERSVTGIAQPMCTSLCFGGDDRRDLYIVSGSEGSDGDRAGAVYRTRVDVPGLPVATARVAIG